MAKFLLKEDLPLSTRQELDRILAISSGLRSTAEAAFLLKLDPDYQTNEVIIRNKDNEIEVARGLTLPTGDSGFAKGARFVVSNVAAGTRALYENIGTNLVADWDLIGGINTSDIANDAVTTAKIDDEAVTDAKLATVLSLAGKTIGLPNATAVNAVAALATLTFTGVVSDGQIVTIGTDIYEFDTNASVTPGNILVDVSGGATAPAAVTALVAAITANTTEPVTAVDGDGDTVVVTADVKGTNAESIITTTDATNGSWNVAHLDGGVDGTLAVQYQILVDANYLYIAVAANTVSGTNWRRIALGSAY